MSNSSHISFILDENIDINLATYLRSLGFNATTSPKGISDQQVIKLAELKKSVLITQDKDFANSDYYKPSLTWGIVVLRVHPAILENNIRVLNKLFKMLPPEKLFGKIIVVNKENAEIIS